MKEHASNLRIRQRKNVVVAVVGLGYVGLPLAEAFSRHFVIIGFDINNELIDRLNSRNINHNFRATSDPLQLRHADFLIIAVPTQVTESKEPDLSHVISASRIVSQNMKSGCIVVLESTVYPGATEEVVKPILEESGKQCGRDFKIAYSPERINPGDGEHSLASITKVVASMDQETAEIVAQLYSTICVNVFKAKSIKIAEAAKLLENTQRDLNIALVNEVSMILSTLGLNINDVLDTAATKWNFVRYSPGLVGGACIPVVPYFLVHKAKEAGYNPQVILAGRSVNDNMPRYVAQLVIKGLNSVSKVIKGSKVLIMGLTYKENVPDTREAPTKDMIKELKEYGVELWAYDPLVENIEAKFGIKAVSDLMELRAIDCLVLTVGHSVFCQFSLSRLKAIMNSDPVLIDIRGFYDAVEARQMGFAYKNL